MGTEEDIVAQLDRIGDILMTILDALDFWLDEIEDAIEDELTDAIYELSSDIAWQLGNINGTLGWMVDTLVRYLGRIGDELGVIDADLWEIRTALINVIGENLANIENTLDVELTALSGAIHTNFGVLRQDLNARLGEINETLNFQIGETLRCVEKDLFFMSNAVNDYLNYISQDLRSFVEAFTEEYAPKVVPAMWNIADSLQRMEGVIYTASLNISHALESLAYPDKYYVRNVMDTMLEGLKEWYSAIFSPVPPPPPRRKYPPPIGYTAAEREVPREEKEEEEEKKVVRRKEAEREAVTERRAPPPPKGSAYLPPEEKPREEKEEEEEERPTKVVRRKGGGGRTVRM